MDQGYPLFYTFHFYLFGIIAIASAVTFVTRQSPVPLRSGSSARCSASPRCT